MSCGVVPRHSLDPALLWLCCRPVAIAPIRTIAWEPPYAVEAALEKAKKKKKKKPQNKKKKKKKRIKSRWRGRGHFQKILPV